MATALLAVMALLSGACHSTLPPNRVEQSVLRGFASQHGTLLTTSDARLSSLIEDAADLQAACISIDDDRRGYQISEEREIVTGPPTEARRSMGAILLAVLACNVRVEDIPSEFGCVDVGDEYRLDSYEHSWHYHGDESSYIHDFAEDVVPALYAGMFVACLASAASQAYAAVGATPPVNMPHSLLFESWLEMCGPGHRNYSEFQWRGGFFSSAGAGAASASGTDLLLLAALVDGGADRSTATDALIDSYHDNRIHCPVVQLPSQRP